MEDIQSQRQGTPSRRQALILGRILGGCRLFGDGFVYSLMYPGCGSRELVSVRMFNSLRRAGWIDSRCRLTVDGQRLVLERDREVRQARTTREARMEA